MGYLITQIIICLLIAALIGFIIGWLLRGIGCKSQDSEKSESAGLRSNFDNNAPINSFSSSPELTESANLAEDVYNEPVTRAPSISHKIEKIEGIGKSLGSSLRNVGIKTTAELIEKCSTENGFQQVLAATNVVDSVVKQWLSMADLMRVQDVNGQFSELLEACDIKSTQDLGKANPAALIAKMNTTNQQEHRIPDSIPLPDVNTVTHWIADAKSLPEKI